MAARTLLSLLLATPSIAQVFNTSRTMCFGEEGGYSTGGTEDVTPPLEAAYENYTKLDVNYYFACGLTAQHRLDCWSGPDFFSFDGVRDFSLTSSRNCLALISGGVRCYEWDSPGSSSSSSSWSSSSSPRRLASPLPIESERLFEGKNVTMLAATRSSYEYYGATSLKLCVLDEEGEVSCLARGPGEPLKNVTKLVNTAMFACALQGSPGNLTCWTHDSGKSRPDGLERVTQNVYDVDTWVWGAICIVNGTRHIQCFGKPKRREGPIDEYVDNVGAPFASVVLGAKHVCGLRMGVDGEVVCWGKDDHILPFGLRGVSHIAAGGRHLCLRAGYVITSTVTSTTRTATTTTETSTTTSSSTNTSTVTTSTVSTSTLTSTTSVTTTTTVTTTTATTSTATSSTATTRTSTSTTTITETTRTSTATTKTSTATSVTSTETTATVTATVTTMTATATATTVTATVTETATATATTATATATTTTVTVTKAAAAMGAASTTAEGLTSTAAMPDEAASTAMAAAVTEAAAASATTRMAARVARPTASTTATDAAMFRTAAAAATEAATTEPMATSMEAAVAATTTDTAPMARLLIVTSVAGLLCGELLADAAMVQAVSEAVTAGILARLGDSKLSRRHVRTQLHCATAGARRLRAAAAVLEARSIVDVPRPEVMLQVVKAEAAAMHSAVQERLERVKGIEEVTVQGAALAVKGWAELVYGEETTTTGTSSSATTTQGPKVVATTPRRRCNSAVCVETKPETDGANGKGALWLLVLLGLALQLC